MTDRIENKHSRARVIYPHLEKWNTVVTIGDSVNEGLWDSADESLDLTKIEVQQSHVDAPVRGWADRLAGHLSYRRQEIGLPAVKYANLAVRGKLIRYIVETELPQALALHPDLVLMDGGGNDILRPGTDRDGILRYFEHALKLIRETGSDVLFLLPQQAVGPLHSWTHAKAADYCAGLHSLANRYDCYAVDIWDYKNLQDERLWSEDFIHPTPEGHERIAQIALESLGLEVDPAWGNGMLRKRLPRKTVQLSEQVQIDGKWVKNSALPWMSRRFRGVSSGDERRGKQPFLETMPASAPDSGSKFFVRQTANKPLTNAPINSQAER
jgi:lysophospholipase L1-like esterase